MAAGVSYRVESLDEHGEWVHWDDGGDTQSTAERRAKQCARWRKAVSRVVRAKVEDDWRWVEVARFYPDPSLKSGARRG